MGVNAGDSTFRVLLGLHDFAQLKALTLSGGVH